MENLSDAIYQLAAVNKENVLVMKDYILVLVDSIKNNTQPEQVASDGRIEKIKTNLSEMKTNIDEVKSSLATIVNFLQNNNRN